MHTRTYVCNACMHRHRKYCSSVVVCMRQLWVSQYMHCVYALDLSIYVYILLLFYSRKSLLFFFFSLSYTLNSSFEGPKTMHAWVNALSMSIIRLHNVLYNIWCGYEANSNLFLTLFLLLTLCWHNFCSKAS